MENQNKKAYKIEQQGDFLYAYNRFPYLYVMIPLFLYLGVVWLFYSVFPSTAIRRKEYKQGKFIYRKDYCLSRLQQFKKTVQFALFYSLPLALGSAAFLYYSYQIIERYYFHQTVPSSSLIQYKQQGKTIRPCFWVCEEMELVFYKATPFVITKQSSNKAYFYEKNKLLYVIPIEKTQISFSLILKFFLSFFFFSLMVGISAIKFPQLIYCYASNRTKNHLLKKLRGQ